MIGRELSVVMIYEMKRLHALFIIFWLPLFLVLSVSWLFAPIANHTHYGSLAVISHYEAINQAWGWLFRTCDLLAAIVLAAAIWQFKVVRQHRFLGILLYMFAALVAVDALFPIGCRDACTQMEVMSRLVHDDESVVAAVVMLALTIVELRHRRHWASVSFLGAQLAIGLLAASGLAAHDALIVLQFVYEVLLISWLGWVMIGFSDAAPPLPRRAQRFIRRAFGAFTLLAGMTVLITAIPHRHLWGHFLDFADKPNELWLSRHGVATGVLLLYIARHVDKGQRRAAGLLGLLLLSQVFKYSLWEPRFGLLAANIGALVVLVWARSAFTRNTMGSLPLATRLQDLGVVFAGVLLALTIVVSISIGFGEQHMLYRSIERIYRHDVSLLAQGEGRLPEHRERQLGAALNTLGLSIAMLALWSLFRPSVKQPISTAVDRRLAADIRARYANSSEDFFKLWPEDKQYFFNARHTGFVAYKLTGSVAFALADPLGPASVRRHLLGEFIDFCHSHGWSVCFLLVRESSKALYRNNDRKLKLLQIGSSAIIDIDRFVTTTQHEKWWRWQYNRAQRVGFRYEAIAPPHALSIIAEMREVSDAWLRRDGHSERGFILGYFDAQYLQRCTLHLLRDHEGKLVAFANELPVYGAVSQRTVDLIRFLPGIDGAMPVLVAHIIGQLRTIGGVPTFDLGFVPLAGLDSSVALAVKRLAKGRFSIAGLQQFKGKFRPDWQANYIAYDGDIVDLAVVLASLENTFKVPGPKVSK